MIEIKARVNIDGTLRALALTAEQSDKALAKGMNDTIREVRDLEQRHIQAVVRNPTAYTLRALWTEFASAASGKRLRARVWLKSDPYSQHYLLPLIEGGGRRVKRFEKRLQMLGHMRANERAVPGQGVALDAYGNISRGLIVKILSQLKTAVVAGDYSNASNSKRSRAKRAGRAYFVSQGPGSPRAALMGRAKGGAPLTGTASQHLPRGVWERTRHAWGSSVRPVIFFVPQHRYNKVLHFFDIAQRVIDTKLKPNTIAAMDRVIQGAGLKPTTR